jgi:hypothetical protein
MIDKFANAFVAVAQFLSPKIKVYGNRPVDIQLEFENKLDFYSAYVDKLKLQCTIKRDIILKLRTRANSPVIQSLERLRIEEEVIEREIELMNIEIEIAAKNYYQSVFAERVSYYEKTQKEISEKAELEMNDLIVECKTVLSIDSVSDKTKDIISGLLLSVDNGFANDTERNNVYLRIKDVLSKIG